MIRSFKHKGLELFFTTGSKKGIQPQHARKLDTILFALESAEHVEELRALNFRLHSLAGELADHWSVWVNGNRRVTFRFEDGNAYVVDYLDYH